MSSDSQFSSEEQRDHQQTRLQSIWKSIKETKNMSNIYRDDQDEGQDHIKIAPKRSQQLSYTRMNNQNQQYREEQLRQNLAHLLQKFQLAQKEIQFLKVQVEKVKREAKEDMDGQRKEYEHKFKKQLKKLTTVEKENICENNEDKKRIQQLSKQVDRLTLKIKSIEHQKKASDAQVVRITRLYQVCQQKSKEDTSSEWLTHQGKGEQLLQLTEAHHTIDRLLQLLKRTEQFRELGPLLEEAKGLHYLKNILKKIKLGQISFTNNNKKTCSCTASKINEKLLWSPAECYRLLLGLKLKHDYLNEECIEQVLFEMNRIYGARQQKRVNKLKDHYENDFKQLKKKLQESYDELLAKKQINRLKKQLRVAKSAKKSRPANKLQDLRTQGQVEDELKLKIRQIKLLQQRVRLLQTENGYNDKTLYWQGALWMIDRVLTDIQQNQGGIKQFQVTFRDRLDSNIEPQDWLRSYKQFFERLAQINSGLVQKLLSIKQAALRKMSQ